MKGRIPTMVLKTINEFNKENEGETMGSNDIDSRNGFFLEIFFMK